MNPWEALANRIAVLVDENARLRAAIPVVTDGRFDAESALLKAGEEAPEPDGELL